MNGMNQHTDYIHTLKSWLHARGIDHAYDGLIWLRWLYVRGWIGGAQDGAKV